MSAQVRTCGHLELETWQDFAEIVIKHLDIVQASCSQGHVELEALCMRYTGRSCVSVVGWSVR